MAKHNPYEQELFKDMPVRIFDQHAWSVEEIRVKTRKAASTVARLAKEKCESGDWERVWKMKDNHAVPAYRPKK